MFKIEFIIPGAETPLDGFIIVLKKLLDVLYDMLWGKKAEDAE